jgi:hypothetical protein
MVELRGEICDNLRSDWLLVLTLSHLGGILDLLKI